MKQKNSIIFQVCAKSERMWYSVDVFINLNKRKFLFLIFIIYAAINALRMNGEMLYSFPFSKFWNIFSYIDLTVVVCLSFWAWINQLNFNVMLLLYDSSNYLLKSNINSITEIFYCTILGEKVKQLLYFIVHIIQKLAITNLKFNLIINIFIQIIISLPLFSL